MFALARDGSSLCRVTRRANALVLHRRGLEYRKPEVISRNPRIEAGGDEKAHKAIIAAYENTLNSMGDDEVALFVDADATPLLKGNLVAGVADPGSRSTTAATIGGLSCIKVRKIAWKLTPPCR